MIHTTTNAPGPTGLTTEDMKQFVRNHFEAFVNRKDLSQAERSFSPHFLDHDEPTGEAVGVEAAQAMMARAHVRWPDLHVTIKDMLAAGDKVVVRNRWTGTEAGTGKRIEFHGFVLWRFAAGKIVERWATITPPQNITPVSSEGVHQ